MLYNPPHLWIQHPCASTDVIQTPPHLWIQRPCASSPTLTLPPSLQVVPSPGGEHRGTPNYTPTPNITLTLIGVQGSEGAHRGAVQLGSGITSTGWAIADVRCLPLAAMCPGLGITTLR